MEKLNDIYCPNRSKSRLKKKYTPKHHRAKKEKKLAEVLQIEAERLRLSQGIEDDLKNIKLTAFSSLRSEKKNQKIIPKTATLYDLAEELQHTAEKANENLNHESISESTVIENQDLENGQQERLYHLNTQKRFILKGNDDYLDYDFHQRKSKEIRRLQYSAGICDKNKYFVHLQNQNQQESDESESSQELEILDETELLKQLELSEIEIEVDSSTESSNEENEEKQCFVINLKDLKQPSDETKNISTQEGTQIDEILKDLKTVDKNRNIENSINKNSLQEQEQIDYQEYRVEFRKGEENFLVGTEVKLWPMKKGMPLKRGYIVERTQQEINLGVDIVVESQENQRVYVKFEKDTDFAMKIEEENFGDFQDIFESEYEVYNVIKETPDEDFKIDRYKKPNDEPLSRNMFIKKVKIENKNCKIFDSCDDHIGDGKYFLINKNNQEMLYYQAVYVYESNTPQHCFIGVEKNQEKFEKIYLHENNSETFETALKQGRSNLGDGRCLTTYIKLQSTEEEPGLRYIFFVKEFPLKRPEIKIEDQQCKLLGDNGETYIGPYAKEDEFSFKLMTSKRGDFILVEPYEEDQNDAKKCLDSVFDALKEKRDQKLREEEEKRQLAILKEAMDKQEMIDLFNIQSKENALEFKIQKIQKFRNGWEMGFKDSQSSVCINRLNKHALFRIDNEIEARRRMKKSKKKSKKFEIFENRDSPKQIESNLQPHSIIRDISQVPNMPSLANRRKLSKEKKSKKSKIIIFADELIPDRILQSRSKSSKRNKSTDSRYTKDSFLSNPEHKISFPKTPQKQVLPIQPEQQVFRSISNSRRRSKAPIPTTRIEPENSIKKIQKHIYLAPQPKLSYFTAIMEMGKHKSYEFSIVKLEPKQANIVNPKIKMLKFLKQINIEPESSEKKVVLEDREIHTVPIHRLKRWSPGIHLSPGKMGRKNSKSPKTKISHFGQNIKNEQMAIKVLKKARKVDKITKKLAYVSEKVTRKKEFSSEKKKNQKLEEIKKLRQIENKVPYIISL